MSEEQDSWFKDAFGLDLGQAAQKIKDEAAAAVEQAAGAVTQVVRGVQDAVEGAIDAATGVVTGVAKKVAGAAGVGPAPGGGGAAGGGSGSFPLGGSVGRGGRNAPGDVRAVQSALGIGVDGQCGGQTIAAIEAFQRNTMGVARPDGRVDAGGATERALAGGAGGGAPPEPINLAADDDESTDLADEARADSSLAQGLVERLVALLKAEGDVAGLVRLLDSLDMRTLLDVVQGLKRLGRLEDLADRTTTDRRRVGLAILTIRPEFDALWRKLVGESNAADRAAVLERTPKDVQVSQGLAPPDGGKGEGPEGPEGPQGGVEVDDDGVKVLAKLEFDSKTFGRIGSTEFAVKLDPSGKLGAFEVDLTLIKQKLEKLGKLGPILDLEAGLSLNAEAEIKQADKKTIVEGVKAGVKAEIQVGFKNVPALKRVVLKFSASAGSGGFEFGGAIEIPLPGT